MSDERHPLDRFTSSPAAPFTAFAWGLAEASVFFIVPDVLLTVLGCRSIRVGLKAGVAAILGALLGGLVMYAAGRAAPEASRSWLAHLPGIHLELAGRVRSQLSEHGLGAVLLGPIGGIPYKVYAVEWGARHGDLLPFLLVSIPARGIRFLISAGLAGGLARWLGPWTLHRPRTEMTILTVFWIGFYALYFNRFGW